MHYAVAQHNTSVEIVKLLLDNWASLGARHDLGQITVLEFFKAEACDCEAVYNQVNQLLIDEPQRREETVSDIKILVGEYKLPGAIAILSQDSNLTKDVLNIIKFYVVSQDDMESVTRRNNYLDTIKITAIKAPYWYTPDKKHKWYRQYLNDKFE